LVEISSKRNSNFVETLKQSANEKFKTGVLNLFEHVAQLINKKGTMAQRLRNYSSVTTAVHVQNINKNNI